MTSARSFLHCILVLTAVVSLTTAFSFQQQKQHTSSSSPARRAFISNAIVATVGISSSVMINPLVANAAGTGALIEDLKMSKDKIAPIPSLLEAGEWDKVRTILKTPPVNALWNLGESKNTLVQLAKETGEFELLELKDELAITLQMCDQLTYDNAFVYFQPGNGKVNIKEPSGLSVKASKQIGEAIDLASQ